MCKQKIPETGCRKSPFDRTLERNDDQTTGKAAGNCLFRGRQTINFSRVLRRK